MAGTLTKRVFQQQQLQPSPSDLFSSAASGDGAPAVAAEPAPTEPETPAKEYHASRRPKDKIEIKCQDCGNTRMKFVEDASAVTELEKAAMFNKHGSYDPPLCGYCVRKRARQKAAA